MPILPFSIEDQLQSLWCWAAVANSISHFYSSPGNPSNSQQCTIAENVLGPGVGPCCPALANCNDTAKLDLALQTTGNFQRHKTGTIPWTKVRNEVSNGLVVGARIEEEGGGGHFVVIYGVTIIRNKRYVHIDDPKIGVGQSLITHAEFKTQYQGNGKWNQTYFTKKNGANEV